MRVHRHSRVSTARLRLDTIVEVSWTVKASTKRSSRSRSVSLAFHAATRSRAETLNVVPPAAVIRASCGAKLPPSRKDQPEKSHPLQSNAGHPPRRTLRCLAGRVSGWRLCAERRAGWARREEGIGFPFLRRPPDPGERENHVDGNENHRSSLDLLSPSHSQKSVTGTRHRVRSSSAPIARTGLPGCGHLSRAPGSSAAAGSPTACRRAPARSCEGT
jgi:hypothetical protein